MMELQLWRSLLATGKTEERQSYYPWPQLYTLVLDREAPVGDLAQQVEEVRGSV